MTNPNYCTIPGIDNLDQLLEAMRADDPRVAGRWDDLPVFGPEPTLGSGTLGVWSWDHVRQIVGECASELEIVPRADEIRRIIQAAAISDAGEYVSEFPGAKLEGDWDSEAFAIQCSMGDFTEMDLSSDAFEVYQAALVAEVDRLVTEAAKPPGLRALSALSRAALADIVWHTPRENQGQIVQVSYGIDANCHAWEWTFDASDRSSSYRTLGPVADIDDWQPWNEVPECAR